MCIGCGYSFVSTVIIELYINIDISTFFNIMDKLYFAHSTKTQLFRKKGKFWRYWLKNRNIRASDLASTKL